MNDNFDTLLKGLIGGVAGGMQRNSNKQYTETPEAASYSPIGTYGTAGIATTPTEASNLGEGVDYITGSSGVRYGLVKPNRAEELMFLMAQTANAYIGSDGDIGKALAIGNEALQMRDNRSYRARQAASLESQGYSPMAIKKWIESGENKDLEFGIGQQVVTMPDGSKVRMSNTEKLAYDKNLFDMSKNTTSQEGNYIVTRNAKGDVVSSTEIDLSKFQQASLGQSGKVLAETIRHNQAMEANTAAQLQAAQAKAQAEQDAKQKAAEAVVQEEAKTQFAKAQEVSNLVSSIDDRELEKVFGAFVGRAPTVTEKGIATEQKFRQLGSQQFLQNIQQMKGMGALSNAEGAKITGASSALFDENGNPKTTLSDAFVKQQLQIIKDSSAKLMKVASAEARLGRKLTYAEEQAVMGGGSPTNSKATVRWSDLPK